MDHVPHPSVAERLGQLAPDLRAAATAHLGPLLVVAPAGSRLPAKHPRHTQEGSGVERHDYEARRRSSWASRSPARFAASSVRGAVAPHALDGLGVRAASPTAATAAGSSRSPLSAEAVYGPSDPDIARISITRSIRRAFCDAASRAAARFSASRLT